MRRKRPEPINIRRNEDLSDIRKAVETTTRADIVIAIGRDWMSVLKNGLVRRCHCKGRSITWIAVWRIRCNPEQERAE